MLSCNDLGQSNLPLQPFNLIQDVNYHVKTVEGYAPMLKKLVASGYKIGTDAFPLPYDWRMPIEETCDRIPELITQIRSNPANNDRPIKIVAHSMGGLLFN